MADVVPPPPSDAEPQLPGDAPSSSTTAADDSSKKKSLKKKKSKGEGGDEKKTKKKKDGGGGGDTGGGGVGGGGGAGTVVPSSGIAGLSADERRLEDLMALWKEVQIAIQDHSGRVEVMENQMAEVETAVDRFGKFCGEYQLIWKLRNFKKCYEEARSGSRIAVLSPAFDTHRNGYRLQLSLCPNGDGKGRGQAMSVFFAIMKGYYDSLLQWPYMCPVNITLLEQVSDPAVTQPRDITMTFTPNPRPDNAPFLGQPTSEKNLSLGFPRFITLEDLFNGEYIRDDTLFIKVRVDLANVVAL